MTTRSRLHMVVDTHGAGHVVGVFSTRAAAERVQAACPGYYRLESCALDVINPRALGWLTDDVERAKLTQLILSAGAPGRGRR